MSINSVVAALKSGKVIAVYDSEDREGEADLIFHSGSVTPEKIELLRKDAGGLICLAVGGKIAKELGLSFISDIVESSKSQLKRMNCKKTAYGDKPAFSITINNKKVYTGITDNDRSLTIKRFSEIVQSNNSKKLFFDEFYSPGHVPLLIGSGINARKGHTELSLELARMVGLSQTMVLCEMLGKGNALSKEKVRAYCKKNGIVFLEGKGIYDIRK